MPTIQFDRTAARFVEGPVTPEVDSILHDFIAAHAAELDEALKPHDLEIALISAPQWTRAFWEEQD